MKMLGAAWAFVYAFIDISLGAKIEDFWKGFEAFLDER